MTVASALAVGIAGCEEVVEFELSETCTAEEIRRRLEQCQPPFAISALEVLPPGTAKAQVRSASYEVQVPPARRAGLEGRVATLRSHVSYPIVRPGRHAPVDLAEQLEELAFAGDRLHMRLRVGQQGSAGPRDVLSALELLDLEQDGVCLMRTAVELCP
jgi:radical SAM-linked protein